MKHDEKVRFTKTQRVIPIPLRAKLLKNAKIEKVTTSRMREGVLRDVVKAISAERAKLKKRYAQGKPGKLKKNAKIKGALFEFSEKGRHADRTLRSLTIPKDSWQSGAGTAFSPVNATAWQNTPLAAFLDRPMAANVKLLVREYMYNIIHCLLLIPMFNHPFHRFHPNSIHTPSIPYELYGLCTLF